MTPVHDFRCPTAMNVLGLVSCKQTQGLASSLFSTHLKDSRPQVENHWSSLEDIPHYMFCHFTFMHQMKLLGHVTAVNTFTLRFVTLSTPFQIAITTRCVISRFEMCVVVMNSYCSRECKCKIFKSATSS